jgi:hypothetical protein
MLVSTFIHHIQTWLRLFHKIPEVTQTSRRQIVWADFDYSWHDNFRYHPKATTKISRSYPYCWQSHGCHRQSLTNFYGTQRHAENEIPEDKVTAAFLFWHAVICDEERDRLTATWNMVTRRSYMLFSLDAEKGWFGEWIRAFRNNAYLSNQRTNPISSKPSGYHKDQRV